MYMKGMLNTKLLIKNYEQSNFFFFQAEDGIRDHCVTGVQTCALPISCRWPICPSVGSETTAGRNSAAGWPAARPGRKRASQRGSSVESSSRESSSASQRAAERKSAPDRKSVV